MNYLDKLTVNICLLLCLLSASLAFGKQSGSYDDFITFNAKARKISVYVPANYDSSKSYSLMICLHGLGDNCSNYRDGIINALNFATYLPTTIFICPEADTTIADFYALPGSEQIIQKCVTYGRKNFNIDTTNQFLQGFSLGGHAALRYGLNHYSNFKGLLLNTPAVQGVKEALNLSAYHYDYQNAPKIPIYITHGTADIFYTAPVDTMYNMLVMNDGVVEKFEFPGMGHAIPNMSKIRDFRTFFDSPATAAYDLDIEKLIIPSQNCGLNIPATLLVRNQGRNKITSIKFQYTINGNSLSYTWSGSLSSFQHALVNFPSIAADTGMQALDVKLTSLNAGMQDSNASNNEGIDTFWVQTKGSLIPLFEGFEGQNFPPPGWALNLSGDLVGFWTVDNTVSRKGSNAITTLNTILAFNNAGRRDEVISRVLDLSTVSNPIMTFDVAYNYDKYTAPYFLRDTFFADTLEVLISTDCGGHYTSLYKKGGSQLATFSSPFLNPTSITSEIIAPGKSNWRAERIDLGSYKADKNALIKFSYISALGGSIYLDDVNFTDASLGIEPIIAPVANLFPNPANDKVYISSGKTLLRQVKVMDAEGRCVFTSGNDNSLSKDITVNTSGLADGIYIFHINTDEGVQVSKVIIRR